MFKFRLFEIVLRNYKSWTILVCLFFVVQQLDQQLFHHLPLVCGEPIGKCGNGSSGLDDSFIFECSSLPQNGTMANAFGPLPVSQAERGLWSEVACCCGEFSFGGKFESGFLKLTILFEPESQRRTVSHLLSSDRPRAWPDIVQRER